MTITPDTTPPGLISVGSLLGSEIGVCFDSQVDPVSATDPFNYTVNGGAVSVTSATLRPNGRQVVLAVTGLPSAAGTPFTVGVTGVLDRAFTPNAGSGFAGNQVVGLASADIGNPGDPQGAGPLPVIACSVEVTTGGSDIWDTHDGFHFDYAPKTGNFDVRVRVESLVPPNVWAKAGLMARENLTPGSRNMNVIVSPAPVPTLDGSGNGSNNYEGNYRDAQDGASGEWPGTARSAGVPYPNAWIRLTRAGNTFTCYRGTDGLNWTQFGQSAQTYPATVNVGLATTAHSLTFLTTAVYQDLFFVPPPVIQTQPTSRTVTNCTPVTFSVGATGFTAVAYQWRHNGTDILCATSDSLTISSVIPADAGSYDVVVSNTGGSTTSSPATLTVVGILPPSIACPGPMILKSYDPAGLVVNYTVTVSDECDPNPVLVCTPPSGSVFPVTNTTVRCTVTDWTGLTNSCSFPVTIYARTTTNFTVGVNVPDASAIGLASTKIVTSPIAAITDLNVT